MSVWPDTVSTSPLLATSDGALVSVSIDVEPRDLEGLLEALAHVDFPINPQIYHDAAITYYYPDGRERTDPATLVEFPAYAGRLDGMHQALEAFGFDPARVTVTGMLDELHAEARLEPAPAGAAYQARRRRKRAGLIRLVPLQ